MNEAETRAEYIDPKLKESGRGVVEGSKVLREFRITEGRIQPGGIRSKKIGRKSSMSGIPTYWYGRERLRSQAFLIFDTLRRF